MTETLLFLNRSIELSVLSKATLLSLLALLAIQLSCRRSASVRHLLLACLFAALAVLPLCVAAGPEVKVRIPTHRRNYALAEVREMPDSEILLPRRASRTSRPIADRDHWQAASWQPFLRSLWMAGAILFLMPIAVDLRRLRRLRRFGLPWPKKRVRLHCSVELLLHENIAAPLTYGVWRPAIFLPRDAAEWPEADLRCAVVHELEHVRRHDWAVQVAARAVCALFWFHPLVWVAWRRLCLEAERACDDAVIQRAECTAYAEQLVALARRISPAHVQTALGMAHRSDLTARVNAILDRGQRRGRTGMAAAAAAVTGSALAILFIAPLRVVAQSAVAQDHAAFAVASVKLLPSSTAPAPAVIEENAGSVRYSNVTLRSLVQRAYQLKPWELIGASILGSYMDTYDLVAKLPEGSTKQDIPAMLRQLLGERFQLAVHRETRQTPVLVLTVDKGGLKLKPSAPVDPAAEAPTTIASLPMWGADGRVHWERKNVTLDRLAAVLSGGTRRLMDRPVLNMTGATGEFDILLDAELPVATNGEPPADLVLMDGKKLPGSAPTLSVALQKMGLKIEAKREPIECLVVDKVNKKPSEN